MPAKSDTTTTRPQRWRGHILMMPTYKPGDLPPEGYLQWHEWAEVQRKAGIKQVECPTCSKWRTPQELSGIMAQTPPAKNGGNPRVSAHSPREEVRRD